MWKGKLCAACIELHNRRSTNPPHNDIRDLTATLSSLKEIEPYLQPLTGEVLQSRSANTRDDGHMDIRCMAIWNKHQDAFFDVRVCNPLASSNQNPTISSTFLRHEKKRRTYDQRVREVEHGSFTPLFFSASGGMGPATTTAYKHLATMLAQKTGQRYCEVMQWLRCRVSFSLL